MEIIILIILIFIQSIFGVGLLLFGTPTFLILNYSLSETLFLLLPISFTISLIQFLKSNVRDSLFLNKFNKFTLPLLFISQIIILSFQYSINLKIFISLMLILLSILSLDTKKFKIIKLNNRYQNASLSLLGIIHGLTNLGGGFLVIYANILTENNKDKTRYYISYAYLVMVSVQMLILFFLYKNEFEYNNLYYLFLILIIYFPTQIIYKKINQNYFSKIIKVIAIIYGTIIFITSISSS